MSTDFSGANLIRADLSGANLSGANLSGANLNRANFRTDKPLGEVLTPEQVKSACCWQRAEFNPQFWEELKASPDPQEPPDCSRSR